MEETYIRDGCYVSFDGWQYQLRAPRVRGDHVVLLDPYVLRAFDDYRRAARQTRNAFARGSCSNKG